MSDNVANTKQEIIKKNWGNLMKKLLLLVPKITVLSERKKTSRKTMIIVGLTFILLIFCILSPHIIKSVTFIIQISSFLFISEGEK